MFTVYGPGITNPVPLEKLFVQPGVKKAVPVAPKQAVEEEGAAGSSQYSAFRSVMAKQQYQAANSVSSRSPALKASQIMTEPVVSLQSHASVDAALHMIDASPFRHIPVLSQDYRLVGMVSDRDILRCRCNSTAECISCSNDKQHILIESIMISPVLSAELHTDARHIARLFVEQRIGAMPVADQGQLLGIITRSDILRAVMVHFDLNLWL